MSAPPGRLIALEGGEGTGKSTQAERLAHALGAVLTHEPGGTIVGRAIRALVLDPELTALDARAEALLLAADRAQHLSEVIDPALAEGTWVVTDRFAGSSLAYQGYGRGLPLEDIEWLSSWATRQRWPDLSVLLEVPPEEVARRRRRDDRLDRLEEEGSSFHARVEAGYRALALDRPTSWVVVDGSGTPDEVAARVVSA
ncbi:MAG: dTMP kinase, partial [Acidimicrobiales bacterium]|nr:dTMP kinase [Acidimicrobiales bacterium]